MKMEDIELKAEKLLHDVTALATEFPQLLRSFKRQYYELIHVSLRESLVEEIGTEVVTIRKMIELRRSRVPQPEQLWVRSARSSVYFTTQEDYRKLISHYPNIGFRFLRFEEFEAVMTRLKSSILEGKLDEDLKSLKANEAIYETMGSEGKLWLKVHQPRYRPRPPQYVAVPPPHYYIAVSDDQSTDEEDSDAES
jgi:hypothetical protein